MKKSVVSGKMLFLLYAFPCAHPRKLSGLITDWELAELKRSIESAREPDGRLLKKCFPDAVSEFVKSAGICDLNGDWPVLAVRNFWRRHKGPKIGCVVWRGVVKSTVDASDNVEVGLVGGQKTFIVLNRYGLKIEVGNIVFLHGNIIAEIEEMAS